MIEVRAFNENDFLDMLPRMWEAEQQDIFSMDPGLVEQAVMKMKSNPAFTMTKDGVPVASFGITVEGETGEAWVYFTPDVRPIKAQFEATLAEHLDTTAQDFGLKKITCGVMKGYEHKMPWVQRLGFERVGERDLGIAEVRYELCLH